jgi:hypothetical protein
MDLIARTQFPAQVMNFALPGVEVHPRWSIIARGTFDIRPSRAAVALAKQPPLAVSDVMPEDGDPAVCAARYESDFVPFKPRADCLCVGTAYTPRGTAQCVVSFGVGREFEKKILVVGNREWVPLGGPRVGATEPAKFKAIPVTFANAYGGQDRTANDDTARFPLNPSGKGYAVSGRTAIGQPLPNLEDPARLLREWSDRVEPRAFGPVGRTWQPRLRRAGTFDDRWQRERAPLPPADFSERYYNAAPDDQQVKDYLRGDEEVRLTNLHPIHSTLKFRLPGWRMRAIVASAPSHGHAAPDIALREVKVNLDTLWVDADALQLVLVWRARIDPRPGDARVLLVEGHLDATLIPPDIFEPVLLRLDAEDAEAERAEAELYVEEPDEEEPLDEDDDDE